MSNRFFVLAACLLGLGALTACSSTDSNKSKSTAAANPDKERVSTLPWNRPASWEGQGSLGGMGLGGSGSRY